MKSLWKRLFQDETPQSNTTLESFAARFHRFRLFLNAHIEAYSSIMSFEERLADDLPVGLPFIRTTLARLTVATSKCIIQLNALSDNAYTRLNEPFAALRAELQGILSQGITPLTGELVVPLEKITEQHSNIICQNILRTAFIRDQHPEAFPKGFVVTAAAWDDYLNNQELQDEVDRLVLIAQSDPAAYGEAGATVQEHLLEHFPMSAHLIDEVKKISQPLLQELQEEGKSLLIRCFPVKPEHGALLMPEQVINGPIDSTEAIITSLHKAMVMTYRPRALIYRLKLGIRSRAMPFCFVFTVIPTVQTRGSAYLGLGHHGEADVVVHIRRKTAGAGDMVKHSPEGQQEAELWENDIKIQCQKVLSCLASSPDPQNRLEIYWLSSTGNDFIILGATPLPEPQTDENLWQVAEGATPLYCGGKGAYPGMVTGQPIVVRNFADAICFPMGGILVLELAAPRWAFLLDFASAAIVQDGFEHAMFARVARRNGRPTVLNMPDVLDIADAEDTICLHVSMDKPACVYPAPCEPCIYRTPDDGTFHEGMPPAMLAELGHTWKSDSLIANMIKEMAPKVALLSFADADDPDFRAENCISFHDFITYSHDHAVKVMYSHVTSRKSAEAPAKQLICDVPKQFWIINLNDGFYENAPGPTVELTNIASIPMRALWEGFVEKPWDGPPAINAKGFLSVLVEATQNPNLDPASQSTHYTEKNVFLISRRFCSMRCRFGFHYLSLDCLLGEREKERFIIFQFKGGAANMSRRVLRVQFIASLLAQHEMGTEIIGDTLTARMEQGTGEEFLSVLRVIGYLVMHTRQLDMIMSDETELAKRKKDMLDDMASLAARAPLDLP